MFCALYMQWGNGLRLWSDITPEQIETKQFQNCVLLGHDKKRSFERFLSLSRKDLVKYGFRILENKIPENLWK